jgi:hypothetical protein
MIDGDREKREKELPMRSMRRWRWKNADTDVDDAAM